MTLRNAFRSAVLWSVLFATNSNAQPETLSLDTAVGLAIERTPQMQGQAAAIETVQSQAIAAGRLPDPELILGVDNLPATGEDAGSFDRDFMTMRKVGLMQVFPSARKRRAERERASAAVSVAQRTAHRTELEIARATAVAWIAGSAAERIRDHLRALKPEVELQSQATRVALSSGRGTTLDALTAQDAELELDDRILAAERDVHAARAELARLIGEDAQRPFASAPAFNELPAPREKLLASLHRHASLLTYDAQLTLAQSEIDVARAQKRSDWSAALAYAKRGDVFSDMVSLEFRVGLPLFSRTRQDPLIGAKRSELTRLQAERETELRMHATEVTQTLAAWDAASQRMAIYERDRLPLARQRTQAALAGFQTGRVDLTAVLASRVAEIEAQRTCAQLMLELGQAWAFLRYLDADKEAS